MNFLQKRRLQKEQDKILRQQAMEQARLEAEQIKSEQENLRRQKLYEQAREKELYKQTTPASVRYKENFNRVNQKFQQVGNKLGNPVEKGTEFAKDGDNELRKFGSTSFFDSSSSKKTSVFDSDKIKKFL